MRLNEPTIQASEQSEKIMTQWLTASEIADGVRNRRLSAGHVVAAALERIRRVDRRLNAFLAISKNASDEVAQLDGEARKSGPLEGVPIAIKDLTDTAGLVTTYGSSIFRNHVPEEDDIIVSRLKSAGAIIIGKTMTPEFGFGAICSNRLKQATCNPWNLELTSGGSSGGAAAAVAAGLVPIAHGTDFGGSVRTPASFCGVLSLRPSPGLIPNPKRMLAFDTLSTHGALSRSVDDLFLFLDAAAGYDPQDPTSLRILPDEKEKAESRDLRIAATEDFGVAPVSSAVRRAMRKACERVGASSIGAVEWVHPDCAGAIAAFHALRQPMIRHSYGALLARHGDELSPTVRWAISQGENVSAADYLAAEARRSTLYRAFLSFFQDRDVLLAPAASVLPWPNAMPNVTEIDGVKLPTVIDYLAITFIVSLACCPVVTLPAWSSDEMPFGIQVIGPPGSDRRLLQYARRLEAGCGFGFRRPPAFASSPVQ